MSAYFTRKDLGVIRSAIDERKKADPKFRKGELHLEAGIGKRFAHVLLYQERVPVPDEGELGKLLKFLGITQRMDAQELFGGVEATKGSPRAPGFAVKLAADERNMDLLMATAPFLTPDREEFLKAGTPGGAISAVLAMAGSSNESGSLVDSVMGRFGFSRLLGEMMGISAFQRAVHHGSILVGYRLGLLDCMAAKAVAKATAKATTKATTKATAKGTTKASGKAAKTAVGSRVRKGSK